MRFLTFFFHNFHLNACAQCYTLFTILLNNISFKNISKNKLNCMADRKYLNKEEQAEYLKKYNIDANRAMLTIILSILVDVLGYSMVLPLLPEIGQSFGASEFLIGLLIASNAFTTLIFGPFWGKLSDNYGRKKILLISQVGTGISFLILALSPNFWIILFARISDGIFGGQIPVIRAYIADITTPETRSQEMSKIMVGHTIGMIIGPLLGGFLGILSWRYPPLVASSFSIVTILLTIKVLIESMPKERIEDIKAEKNSFQTIPGNIKRKVLNREVLIRLLQILLVFTMTVMLNSSLSLILDKKYGADTALIGLIIAVAGIALMVYAGLLLKPLIQKLGEKNLIFMGIFMLIITFAIIPYLTEVWMMFIIILPFVFGMAALPPLIQTNLTRAVDADQQGEISGWTTNFQSIAQIIAPLIATWYLQINGISFGFFYLDSYQLIGYTAVIIGILIVIILFIDFRMHPNLYSKKVRLDQPIIE
ncbi:MAG: MFS transporter [Candidatus Lokiarchaeota archaeon]|nr:MFS transporter [Candidatus Lokiarchaeota archaeon]MBD3198758.1 MFS transporter [Candidatus Lokiarchaeota archaeon]